MGRKKDDKDKSITLFLAGVFAAITILMYLNTKYEINKKQATSQPTSQPTTIPACKSPRADFDRQAALFATSGYQKPKDGINNLLEAICIVESNNNIYAIGDNGRAKGCFQIWRSYWTDACKFGGVLNNPDWDYDKAVLDKAKCEQVIKWYWQRYNKSAYENKDYFTLARMHKAGRHGDFKPATLAYWKKVKYTFDAIQKGAQCRNES